MTCCFHLRQSFDKLPCLTKGINWFPTNWKGEGAWVPHQISTSLRLILAGPTPLRGGATQKCGGEAPAIIFVCPSPTRVGAAEDEVMGGDDLLGHSRAPSIFCVWGHIKRRSSLPKQWKKCSLKRRNSFHFIGPSLIAKPTLFSIFLGQTILAKICL